MCLHVCVYVYTTGGTYSNVKFYQNTAGSVVLAFKLGCLQCAYDTCQLSLSFWPLGHLGVSQSGAHRPDGGAGVPQGVLIRKGHNLEFIFTVCNTITECMAILFMSLIYLQKKS